MQFLYTDVIKSNMQEKIGYEGRRLQKGLFIILVQTCSYVHAESIKTKTEIKIDLQTYTS